MAFKYRTEHDHEPDEFKLPEYSKTEKKYKLKINKDGSKELVEDGETNVYEQIQSYKTETDFETIINQIKQGIRPANVRQGTYLTEEPATATEENLTQMHETIKGEIENANRANRHDGSGADEPARDNDQLSNPGNHSPASTKGKIAATQPAGGATGTGTTGTAENDLKE